MEAAELGAAVSPFHKPVDRELLDWEKEFNTGVNRIRYVIEKNATDPTPLVCPRSGSPNGRTAARSRRSHNRTVWSPLALARALAPISERLEVTLGLPAARPAYHPRRVPLLVVRHVASLELGQGDGFFGEVKLVRRDTLRRVQPPPTVARLGA